MEIDTLEDPKAEFLRLENERARLEEQIKTTRALLEANKVGMKESLVDAEDFPRSDVDVYDVRLKRNEVIRAENDYKNLMQRLEELLEKYHSVIGPQIESREGRPPTLSNDNPQKLAIVGEVTNGSPSFVAGLRKGDAVIEFGSVNSSNFTGLQDISREVERSVNSYIKVIVDRDGHFKRFNLKPKTWEGRGLLGCLLLPVQQ